MENKKIINEISRIMEIMNVSLINEGPVGPKPKFSFNFGKTHKIFDDASIKKFNLNIDNTLPTVTKKKKLTTKAELDNILDNFSSTKWDDMKPAERQFLKDLNEKMAEADPAFINKVTDDFYNRVYKNKDIDQLSKIELLDTFKSGFSTKYDVKIDEIINTKEKIFKEENKSKITRFWDKIVGSSENTSTNGKISTGFFTWLSTTKSGGLVGLSIAATVAPAIFCYFNTTGACEAIGRFFGKVIEKLNLGKGQELFLKLIKTDPLPEYTAKELCENFGRNQTEIQNDVNLFSGFGSWFDVTDEELQSIISKLSSTYDGMGLIIFNKLFVSGGGTGMNLYQFLIKEDKSDAKIQTAIVSTVPETFSIFGGMPKVQPEMEEIERLMTNYLSLTNTGTTGVESIFIKTNKDSWVPIGKGADIIINSNYTTDGTQITLSINTQTEIQQKAKELLANYLSQVEDRSNITIPTDVKSVKSLVTNSPGEEKSWMNKLDWESVDKTITPQLDSYFKDTLGKISWDWYHAIPKQQIRTESKIGLVNLLLENKKKILTEDEKTPKTSSGGATQLASTPFKTQAEGDAFRAWVIKTDATYTSQIGLDATGPINNTTIKKAYQKYGTQYQQFLTSGSGTPVPAPDVDKEKEIFDKFNNSVFFYSTNNEPMNIEYKPEIAKWIKYYTEEHFGTAAAYLGAILSLYGNMISKYKTNEQIQNSIDYYLPDLQSYLKTLFEGIQIQKTRGLAQILEQQVRPLVTVNVVNRIPQKRTEDNEYKDMPSITIKSIIGGGTELKKGDKSDTVIRVKEALKYTKDKTPYFTDDFNTFVINYKGTNKLDNTNGNISQDLLCSIEQYKQLCSTSSSKTTTAPPKQLPIEVKYLNDYATAVGTGTPSEGPCKSLFDYYVQQAKDWDTGNRAGSPNTEITAELLTNAKTAVKRCKVGIKKTFYPKDRKYITDKNSPFYIVDFDKEAQKTATTPTVATNNTPNPVDTKTGY